MSLKFSVQQLNEMVANKQILEAFEQFYSDDITMVESGGEPMAGKEANRERERAFVGGLTKWDAQLLSSAVDEATGTALNEWVLTYDHSGWGAATMRQVAVQRWRDGRIVHESFYKL
ncbi:MAG: nuclear transport factor 2 family protein [Acidobacteriota bacterium]|nr:nuclear transport factor 2 family protein [Acidobacteriota bacterium]